MFNFGKPGRNVRAQVMPSREEELKGNNKDVTDSFQPSESLSGRLVIDEQRAHNPS